MFKFHSRRKKKAIPAPETTTHSLEPKSVTRTPTEASSSTFETLSTAVEHTRLTPLAKASSNVLTHSRSRSSDRKADPLGLTVIYEPDIDPSLDIVFVHGLGGTSRATWCYNRDLEYFWPGKWLSQEPEIKTARILSFGYNAHFSAPGSAPITGISDFAKDLLFGMKYAKNAQLEEIGMGERPIIFIAHSMGGLVVKKAYTLGQNSSDYMEIVSSTKAILFLATPHRGTNLADILNRILSASIFSHGPKQYVAELSRTSPALEDLNEQFRHLAPRLQIISFFETLPTPIGPKKVLVLEKGSSILGLSTEASASLHADHHHVCKFENTQDSNYIIVRNALKTIVSKLRREGQRLLGPQGKDQLTQLEGLLALVESPTEDLAFLQKRWTPGTCQWVLANPEYLKWTDGREGSNLIWLNALPAAGKSVLSSFIVNDFIERKVACAYYFFRFSTQTQRSLSACLRSLAFQIAEQLPSFRRALLEISKTGVKLDKADAKTIWQQIFISILFKMTNGTTFYWVIDGLDETDSPRLLVELMQSIKVSMFPVRVMLVSRRTPELISAFARLAAVNSIQYLTIEDNEHDIRQYVEQEIDFMHANPELKVQVVQKLLERANGNFLWVNLALKEILQCLTPADIEETLEGLPGEMEELYKRMELSILKSTRPRDQELAKIILSWAACPRRPLLLLELEEALKPEFPVLLDLSFTINQVCGQFVIIDSSSQVVMVHQTAREYLVKSTNSGLAIVPGEAHRKMFARCIRSLDQGQRRGSERRRSSHLITTQEPFLSYAATSWPYHLDVSSATSEELLDTLTKFLRSPSVLSWISSLAIIGQLKVLVQASRALNTFVRRRRKYDLGTNPMLHRLRDLELVELWAIDLIKILGKFGPNLIADPASIYNHVPPFCPRDSMIHKQFGANASGLTVHGLTNASWDDSLAKISLGSGSLTIMMVCAGYHFAVLTASGQIVIYSTITLDPIHILLHGERVSTISFSHSGNELVSCGFRSTKIWSVITGKITSKIQNPASTRALQIAFSADDFTLIMASADRGIRHSKLKEIEPSWSFLDRKLLREDDSVDRTVTNSPCCISFSPDATHVAVAYRGFPLSVWRLDPPELISRCRRNPNDPNKLWAPVERVLWHPFSGDILGIYLGGYVFKWHPYNGTHQEIYASASVIACSPEGTFFATGDASGKIKLFNFDHFALVYQLSCDNVVNDIAFSPDSRRLYDLRGQFCNVWEPNALLRLDDIDEQEHGSEVESELGSLITTGISEAVAEIRDPITAISSQPGGTFHAAGDEAGVISIFNSSTLGSAVEISRSASMLTIEHLDWGADGQHLACAELGGKITMKLLIPANSDGGWVAKLILDVKFDVEVGGIQQILLNADSTILLIGNRESATILMADGGVKAATISLPSHTRPIKWITHPSEPMLLLAFSIDFVRVYRWHDLSQVAELEISGAPMRPQDGKRPSIFRTGLSEDSLGDENEKTFKINKLFTTSTGSNIIFQYTMTSRTQERHGQTMIFDALALDISKYTVISSEIVHSTIIPISLPEDIEIRVEIPLGILPKNRFVYLDKDFSMCSVRLTPKGVDEKTVQKHFFLPRDWLNIGCLELCALLPNGTFLIPNNGEIATIQSSVSLDW